MRVQRALAADRELSIAQAMRCAMGADRTQYRRYLRDLEKRSDLSPEPILRGPVRTTAEMHEANVAAALAHARRG